jgi:hypothetical protein
MTVFDAIKQIAPNCDCEVYKNLYTLSGLSYPQAVALYVAMVKLEIQVTNPASIDGRWIIQFFAPTED